MIEKVVKKRDLNNHNQPKEDLEYWLSRTPEERLAAVEILREQYYGTSADFKELLELLNSNEVDYIVVGGYAMAFHGSPRLTGDIDLFIQRSSENAERLLRVLEQFGFGSLELSIDDFTRPNQVVQLGHPPIRIYFLTSLDGVESEEANSAKIAGRFGDVPVYYIEREQLIQNKRALGRARDIADIEALDGN